MDGANIPLDIVGASQSVLEKYFFHSHLMTNKNHIATDGLITH